MVGLARRNRGRSCTVRGRKRYVASPSRKKPKVIVEPERRDFCRRFYRRSDGVWNAASNIGSRYSLVEMDEACQAVTFSRGSPADTGSRNKKITGLGEERTSRSRVNFELLFPRVFTEKRKRANGSSGRRENGRVSVVGRFFSSCSFTLLLRSLFLHSTHSREYVASAPV